MPTDVPLRCACGALRGVARGLSPERGNRLVCYCDDCQSFAYFLGRAEEILDIHGGTDIFQMSPARIEFTEGVSNLACVRLTPRGLMRWYASCCNTPVGNTIASGRAPFLGSIHSCMDHAGNGRTRDAVLGPSRGGVNGRFARGERTDVDAHDKAPLSMGLRLLTMMLRFRLGGDHKRSPFFDAAAGKPTALPRVLTDEELRQVESSRDAGVSGSL
jgi:hypothetical protein